MSKFRRLGAIALLAAVPATLCAGGFSHRVWRAEDGLPGNRIQALQQTPDGYLWIGTSSGLARFDGARFVVFDSSNTPALLDESILSLLSARDGSLWAGTEGGGLVHYRNGSFTNFGEADGLTNGFVRSVEEDEAGRLWVGTDRGFFRFDGKRFVRLDQGTAASPYASVVKSAVDSAGRIWIGTHDGLLTVANGMVVPAFCHGARASAEVRGLYRSSGGKVFTLDADGFSEIRDGCRVASSLARESSVRAMLRAGDGKLWIGTGGEGLMRYGSGKPQVFTAPSTLPDNAVTVIFEDRERNVWAGTRDGLALLASTSLTTIGTAEGLDDDHVVAVAAVRKPARPDEILIATLSGELYKLSGGTLAPVPLPGIDVREFQAHTMLEDSKGGLWLGSDTAGAVGPLRGPERRHFDMATGLRSNDIRQIYEDEEGNIWFATGSGVSRWDGKAIRNYYLPDGLSYPSTRVIARNPGGGLLIGTDRGLNLVQHGEFVPVPAFAPLKREKIWAILPDADGVLWLGTRGGGLIRVRHGLVTRFTTRQGLRGNAIFQILDDGKGKLWLSNPTGISSVLREELGNPNETVHAVPYGQTDGMLTSQMFGGAQPAGARSASGELWFPSMKGVVRIDPSSLPVRRPMPVVIERVVSGGHALPLSSTITVPPGHGRLGIDYTSCNLSGPERLSFQYRLEGFDDRWVTAVRSRSAWYTNLPPRKYRFVVRAIDAASPLRISEASIDLDIRPAFYQTAWFFALCAFASILCLLGGSRIYARQTRSRYALLLAERTRLAREMHDTVIQGCVGVSALLEAAGRLQQTQDPGEAGELVGQAREQIRNTLTEARQAVWDLRNPAAVDAGVSSLVDLARRLGIEKGILVDIEVSGSSPLQDPELDRTLLLVGREALRNAVTHGNPGRIDVRLAFRALDVELEVKDNGVGLASDAAASAEKGHFGIVGMRERVEMLGGSLALKGAAGKGTSVLARIPIGRHARHAADRAGAW